MAVLSWEPPEVRKNMGAFHRILRINTKECPAKNNVCWVLEHKEAWMESALSGSYCSHFKLILKITMFWIENSSMPSDWKPVQKPGYLWWEWRHGSHDNTAVADTVSISKLFPFLKPLISAWAGPAAGGIFRISKNLGIASWLPDWFLLCLSIVIYTSHLVWFGFLALLQKLSYLLSLMRKFYF